MAEDNCPRLADKQFKPADQLLLDDLKGLQLFVFG